MAEGRLSKTLRHLQATAWSSRGPARLEAFWYLAQAFEDIGWAADAANSWAHAAAAADDYRHPNEFLHSCYSAAEWYRLAGYGCTAAIYFYKIIDIIGHPGRTDKETELFARSVHGIADLVAGEWISQPEYYSRLTDHKPLDAVALMNTWSDDIDFLSPADWQEFGSAQHKADPRPLSELLELARSMLDTKFLAAKDSHARMQRAAIAETLHARAIDILAPFEKTHPLESELREQLARARQCHGYNFLLQQRRKEASALLREACRHWYAHGELADDQKVRFSGALEMLGLIELRGRRAGRAYEYFDRATALIESVENRGGLYRSAYMTRLVEHGRRAGSAKAATELLVRARHIATSITDFDELCVIDRTLMQAWEANRAEYAFRWGLSSILACITQLVRAEPADREPLLRWLGNLYNEVWVIAQRVRMTQTFVMSLVWLAYTGDVASHVRLHLRGANADAQPIPIPPEMIPVSLAEASGRLDAILVAADIGDFWCLAYLDQSGHWDVLAECDDLLPSLRKKFARVGIDVADQFPVGPLSDELEELVELCLLPLTACLPVRCRAAVNGRIIKNGGPLRIGVVPCGPFTQSVPWAFVPVDDEGAAENRRLMIDGAMASLLTQPALSPLHDIRNKTRGPDVVGAITTSAAVFELPDVTHVESTRNLLEEMSNEQYHVTHIAGHSRVVAVGTRREVRVEFGRRATFGSRNLAAVTTVSPLMILSSCMSASTGWVPGGEWGGMAAEFFSRGATSAIATIWAIPEDSGTTVVDRELLARHVAGEPGRWPDQASILRALQLEFVQALRGTPGRFGKELDAVRSRHLVGYCCVMPAGWPSE